MVPAVNTNPTLSFFFVYFRIYPIRLIPQTVECFRVWYVEIRITAMATYPMPLASIMLTGILKVSYIVGCFQIGLLLCGIVAGGFIGSHICVGAHTGGFQSTISCFLQYARYLSRDIRFDFSQVS